jgi:hypothetical protein
MAHTEYTKATNFTSKDSLPPGDTQKKVRGSEFDTEFNLIAGAIDAKSDLVSPAFTGSPTAPTTAVDTNSTQLATTAFVLAQIANDAQTAGDGIDITNGVISIDSTSNGYGVRTVSTSSPTGGNDGDIWYKVSA